MKTVFDAILLIGLPRFTLFVAAVVFIGLPILILSDFGKSCDCPRYLLRRQSGEGLVWKSHHRADCPTFGAIESTN